MKTRRSFLGVASCLAIALVAAQIPASAVTSDANLVDLLRLSQTIISGSVVSVTDGFDERGIPYTEITLDVDETFKGRAGDQYSFRQFGLTAKRSLGNGRVMMPAPMEFPSFSAGEQVLLFLPPRASNTGLQTTVGLQVGKFDISAGRAENSMANEGVFTNVSLETELAIESDRRIFATGIGAVNPDSLRSLVRRAVAGNWVETCKMWDTVEGKTCKTGPPRPPKPRTPTDTPETTPVLTPDLEN